VAAAQQQAHLTEALARSSSSMLAHSSTGQGLPKLRTLRASLELGQARSPAAATAQQESTPLLLGAQDSGKQWQQPGGASAGEDVAVVGGGAGAGRGVVAGLSDASAQVDNPDQRITADVSNYVQTSVGLVLLLVRKTLNCAAFAGKGNPDTDTLHRSTIIQGLTAASSDTCRTLVAARMCVGPVDLAVLLCQVCCGPSPPSWLCSC
jgi:hypothetical protein